MKKNTIASKLTVSIEPFQRYLLLESKRTGMAATPLASRLAQEALVHRYMERSIAEIVNEFDFDELERDSGIPKERIAAIACGQKPTIEEVVNLSKVHLLSPEQLYEIAERTSKSVS